MPTDVDLGHHGDRDVAPGLVDLAVNVRAGAPPSWLLARLTGALGRLAAYPDQSSARAAVAARHGRPAGSVLLTAGAAEGFVLLARTLRPRRAVVVHPQFTEPEAALRAAGHEVERVVLAPPFRVGPGLVPEDADLVVVGNPTNPTSVLHPASTLSALCRPGRVVVVDEAFMDAVPGEAESLAGRSDLPGLVVVRSLTKTWGLAGLRVGYLLADPALVARLQQAQPLWPLSAPALVAVEACSAPSAVEESATWARGIVAHREHLAEALAGVPGVDVVPDARGPFLLLRTPVDVRSALRDVGFAVRRGDTFPGLGPEWARVAVRDPDTSDAFVRALRGALGQPAPAGDGGRPVGSVALVGGGPGDPALLTVRGLQLLAAADVVVADRLGPTTVLDGLAPGVKVVDASKTPGGRTVPQEETNARLVSLAREGKRVVRLKGGDPYVFARGWEELAACRAAGVPVEVVPGVTSALGAPAAADVPVTHRELAQEFVVVSGHVPPGDPRSTVDWDALARLNGTLVLLMAVDRLPAISAALVAGGRGGDTPVAVVQQGTLEGQRVLRTTLAAAGDDCARAGVRPPAVVVVGAVAGLVAG
ncbi:Rv2231c family pyridoxal phosphate-dependent protein CobC [Motilibacter aurantiacus]|uniref:Rv2231c family pyridoxal phosphate-dependent protein CobC n=1 Tax=Motilibacter aurantiacus TaxID=2714955 RepID=UPI0014077519|nr:Rv2231c family pyridoxal phosphate-dependent protein CobC [Motilibacter aurantiacus]NHC45171.1 threonine-phosphate decarboxylase [Motilibacter aurantiacus]